MNMKNSVLKAMLAGAIAGGFFSAGVTPVLAQAGADKALAAAAKEPGAKVTASGLVINMVKEGTGTQPTATSS